VSNINKAEILKTVIKDGFIVIPDYWSGESCEKARADIDSIIANKVESVSRDEFGADNRIFGIEHLSQLIREKFYQDPTLLSLFSLLYNVKQTYGTVLGEMCRGKNR